VSFGVNDADSQGYVHVVVPNLNSGSSYSFNVLVTEPGNSWSVYTPSSAMVVNVVTGDDSSSSSNLRWIFGLGIPIVILLLAGIAYLVYRNRQLSKELEIEMHDVPKSAVRKAVRGPEGNIQEPARPNKNAQKYSTLLTEDEDEGAGRVAPPSDDVYAPPRDVASEI